MLLFKDIQDSDKINAFIEKEGIADKLLLEGDYFGCLHEDELIGLCKIKIRSDALVLIYIHFKDEYKSSKLESALLKCLLFRFESLEYNELVSLQKNKELDNIGFKEIEGKYKLILKDFLVSDCCCGVSVDER